MSSTQEQDSVPNEKEAEVVQSEEPITEVVESQEERPGALALTFIVLSVNLSIFLTCIDLTIIATAIPRITDQLNSLSSAGWYGSAYFATIAAFQATWGKCYKYFGLKWTFIVAIFFFELGSLICGVAPNSTALIVGRAVAGIGGGGVGSGAFTILAFAASQKRLPVLVGLIGATYALAMVLLVYINLPIGGVVVLIIVLFFKAPPSAKPQKTSAREKFLQLDLAGSALILAAMICLLLALQWGGLTKPWGSSDVIGTLAGFFVITVVFIVNEIWMGERALLIPRLLRQKTLGLASAYILFNGAGFYILIYYLPYYFQSVHGVSAAQSGIRNLPYIISTAMCSLTSGAIVSFTGHYFELQVFGSSLVLIGAGMIYTLGLHSPVGKWIGYQILAGSGAGLSNQIPIIVSQTTARTEDVASVTAVILFFQTITGAVFISTAQSIFVNGLVKAVNDNVPDVVPQYVVVVGAAELRETFTPDQLAGILRSYMRGLKDAYLFAISLAGVAVILAVVNAVWDARNLNEEREKRNAGNGDEAAVPIPSAL
ncbi:hypothetical protein PRZ48_012725 [Zasmidium cellare]|uniref:Major facilitator superfamily (MFS) profile domain-containing protein n=1 Tax=Zasmidium cellare TaxID=395010 RepID=A0ABR0E5M9_ZASCE|nr:hypothetical protein PRZ48_012725 [Zasmidium cellare]